MDSPVAGEVIHLVEAIATRGDPIVANRTLGRIRLIFNDELRRGFPTLEAHPAHLVEPSVEQVERDRYLTREEMKAVWQATKDEALATHAAYRLTLLTGQWIGSVSAIRLDGITGDLCTIPPEHFKERGLTLFIERQNRRQVSLVRLRCRWIGAGLRSQGHLLT